MPPLLEVKELHTEFRTGAGIVRAVDGISYTVDPGETRLLSKVMASANLRRNHCLAA